MLRSFLNLRMHPPDLGTHTSVSNQTNTAPVNNRRPCKHDTFLPLNICILLHSLGSLTNRLALSRQRPLLNSQRRTNQTHNTHIRRDLITHPELHNITRNKLLSRQARHFNTITHHSRLLRLNLLQSLQRLLGISLLPDPNNGVNNQDQENHQRLDKRGDPHLPSFLPINEGGDNSSRQKNTNQRVIELLQYHLENRCPLRLL